MRLGIPVKVSAVIRKVMREHHLQNIVIQTNQVGLAE